MEIGYCSILTKEALIYNLVYHAKNSSSEDELSDRIRSVLNSFEYKEGKYSEKLCRESEE